MAHSTPGQQVPRTGLGNTGLNVSILGFGGSALGGVFQPVQEDECKQAVHDAFHAGVNFFDTSPFYGGERAETMLGKCLQGLPRYQIIISTKVGRYQIPGSSSQESKFDFSAERVTASVFESMKRIQTDYLDIVQCHDIEFGDIQQIVTETIPALVKLKQQGIIKHIGITGLPLKVFHLVLDHVAPGTVEVVMSYCHNTLCDRTLLAELPYLQSRGVGVLNASPLSMGLLTQSGPPDWHPAPPAIKQACRDAAARAAGRGVDIARLALTEAIRSQGVASTVVSMPTAALVASNVQTALEACGVALKSAADIEAQALADVQVALAGVQGMTWPSGRPENN